MNTFKTTIEWNEDTGEEREIEVTYRYYRGCHGARDSLGGVRGAGPALEPDEPPSVEILNVMMHSPTPLEPNHLEDLADTMSDKLREWLEEKCFEDQQDGYEENQRERHEI